jgi:hypothetical protein
MNTYHFSLVCDSWGGKCFLCLECNCPGEDILCVLIQLLVLLQCTVYHWQVSGNFVKSRWVPSICHGTMIYEKPHESYVCSATIQVLIFCVCQCHFLGGGPSLMQCKLWTKGPNFYKKKMNTFHLSLVCDSRGGTCHLCLECNCLGEDILCVLISLLVLLQFTVYHGQNIWKV